MPHSLTEDTGPRRLHPMAIIGDFIRQLPQYIIAIVAGGSAFMGVGIWLFLGGGMAAGLAAFLRWYFFRYTILGDGLLIESGVLSKQRRSIGFDRIQDIEVERGLLARMTGTAHVRLETGGSSEDEGDLRSVSDAEADRLRECLKLWRDLQTPSTQAEDSADPAPAVIYKMPFTTVLRSGLYRFSFTFLAIFGAVFQVFQPSEEDIVALFGSEVESHLMSLMDGGFSFLILAGIAATLLLLGFLSGIVLTIFKDYGFQLTFDERGLHRKRGLLTRTEGAIPFRRIQAAGFESGPLRRWQERHDLFFQTLGSGKRSGGRQDAAPFSSPEDWKAVLAIADFRDLVMDRKFRSATYLLMLRAIFAITILTSSYVAVADRLGPAVTAFAGAVIAALLITGIFGALREGYLVEDDRLTLRQGWWRQRIWLVPFRQVQIAEMTRGPVQKLTGTATLHVDFAGAPTMRPARVRDVPVAEAERLMALLSQKVGRSAGVIQPNS